MVGFFIFLNVLLNQYIKFICTFFVVKVILLMDKLKQKERKFIFTNSSNIYLLTFGIILFVFTYIL